MTAELFPVPVSDAVARIRAHDQRVRCFVSTRLDDALAEADGRTGPLAGVPYGLKDEFDTPHLGTTGGSWRHRDRVTPGVSSAPHRAFEAAGAVLLGKTNLSDLGLPPEASSYVAGSTLNPFDPTRTAGGSSGGSAAGVAYGFTGFDWGTDIGGSIRLPAAFCGVLGLKLSDASWPIQELFPTVPPAMRWLCGQGPFTRSVDEMRAVLASAAPVLRQMDPVSFAPSRVALYAPDAGSWPTFADDVTRVLQQALELPVTAADLPPPRQLQRVFAGIWASHLDHLLESDPSITLGRGIAAVVRAVTLRGRFGDRRFHPTAAELLLLIAIGRHTLYRDPVRAKERGLSAKRAFDDVWADGQVIVAPVTPVPPPRIGTSNRHLSLLSMTAPGNLADTTAIAIPFGTFDGRLPRAIQLMGPPGSEDALLELADRVIAARDADPSLAQPSTLLS